MNKFFMTKSKQIWQSIFSLAVTLLCLLSNQSSFAFECNPIYYRHSLVFVANTATAWVQGKVIEKTKKKLTEGSQFFLGEGEIETKYSVAVETSLFGATNIKEFQFKTNNAILGAERQFSLGKRYLFFMDNDRPEVSVCLPVPASDSQEAADLKNKLLYQMLSEKDFHQKIQILRSLQKANSLDQAENLALSFRGPDKLDGLRLKETILIERQLGRFAVAAELANYLPGEEKQSPELLMSQAEDYAKATDLSKTILTLQKLIDLKIPASVAQGLSARLNKTPAFQNFSPEENKKIREMGRILNSKP